ncbi:hypothetical protein J3A64_001851 [Pseudarthrobacter sp. PvP004]|uniref:hypothetical protein n=1 Tax=Pseudarthrobacter sp. PvP004 TaxID=2817850 RepID=UPI00257059DE|nr:hypothetical protein [Pseudarthrobacter sp. PvP004]MBP2266387.1 hypothetical protein [Pseudarthrobacter sp. PvP004]
MIPRPKDILSPNFLAAALGDLPVTQVYIWVIEHVSQEPFEILRKHDYELQDKGLESPLKLADKAARPVSSAEDDPVLQEPEHAVLNRPDWWDNSGNGTRRPPTALGCLETEKEAAPVKFGDQPALYVPCAWPRGQPRRLRLPLQRDDR